GKRKWSCSLPCGMPQSTRSVPPVVSMRVIAPVTRSTAPRRCASPSGSGWKAVRGRRFMGSPWTRERAGRGGPALSVSSANDGCARHRLGDGRCVYGGLALRVAPVRRALPAGVRAGHLADDRRVATEDEARGGADPLHALVEEHPDPVPQLEGGA